MKKLLSKLMTIVAGILLLLTVSCSKEETSIESNLSLSEKALNFTKSEGEKSIKVITNSEDWNAIGSAEWIEVLTNEKSITIKVRENTNIASRKGRVLVVAGSANSSIEITQEGTAPSISVTQEKIETDSDPAKVTVDVVANDKNWTATTSADWISLVPKNYKYELDIQIKENKERTDRTAEITLTVGKINKVILVKQSGVLYYILPNFNFKADAIAIKNFESARKSILTYESSSKWFKKLEFKTRSALFNKILYEFNSKKVYEKATIYVDKTKFPQEKAGFIEFLTKNGFVKDTENIYYNAKESVQAEIEEDAGKIIYTLVIKQDKAYATFTSFPYGFYQWYATKDDISSYEAKNGGTLDTSRSRVENNVDVLVFTVNSSEKNSPYERFYEVSLKNKKGLHVSRQFFKNVNLAFYKGKDGEFYLTDEFSKLAKKEGFKFLGKNDNGFHIFVNAPKNTNMLVRASIFKENNNVPELEIALLAKDRNQP